MAEGNKHLGYKNALNELERVSPGTKADFYFSFLKRAVDRFAPDQDGEEDDGLGWCHSCGHPASGEICAFCRLVDTAGGRPVAVDPPRVRS